jgi:hypothetical protein
MKLEISRVIEPGSLYSTQWTNFHKGIFFHLSWDMGGKSRPRSSSVLVQQFPWAEVRLLVHLLVQQEQQMQQQDRI